MDTAAILRRVLHFDSFKVTITGGEPLLQTKSLEELVAVLYHHGYRTTIETNGSIPISDVLTQYANFVVDWKLNSSGMERHMDSAVFMNLSPADFVKFVIRDRNDFFSALAIKNQLQSDRCCATFAFSPMYGVMDPAELAGLMSEFTTDGVLNLQLHKIIGLVEDSDR